MLLHVVVWLKQSMVLLTFGKVLKPMQYNQQILLITNWFRCMDTEHINYR